ncbi:hypothetical protein D030_4201A, partial [Vibrio parahaemolyticus AQ3810]
MIQIVRRL